MIRKQDLINVELELNEDQKAIKGDPVKVANAIVMEINFIAGLHANARAGIKTSLAICLAALEHQSLYNIFGHL